VGAGFRAGDTVIGIGARGKLCQAECDWMVLIGTNLTARCSRDAGGDRLAAIVVARSTTNAVAASWRWLASRNGMDVVASGSRASVTPSAARPIPVPAMAKSQVRPAGRFWRNHSNRWGRPISHHLQAYWGVGRANATHGEPLE